MLRTVPFYERGGMMKKVLAGMLAFCLFGTSAPAFAEEHPWVLKRDKDGIQVSVRKVAGSAFLEYKAVVTVDTSLEEVVRLYEEKENGRMPEWFHQCREVRLLEARSSEDKLYYFILWMPPPFQTRDLVYRRLRVTDPAGDVVEYKVRAMPELFPPQSGKVRMPSADGYWRLSRRGEGKTEVYYQQHSDMGGAIPPWLVNLLAVDMPYNTLVNFRRLLLEEKNKK